MDFYLIVFLITLTISLLLTYNHYRTSIPKDIEQNTFQRQYLIVYTLAYFSDWLKGPYIYALYKSYGFTEHNIAILFITGFAASGLSGPFVGSLADKFGRKKLSIAYFIIYLISALCKPFTNFHILILGRILGGIGTSLLTTTFESWMVAEHQRRKYSQELLDDTFTKATLCNSGSAVIAGLIAQASADRFGYLAPFLIASAPLTSGLICCAKWWDNDKPNNSHSLITGFQDGMAVMDTNIWIIGLTQSFFGGAMYTFVFLWTPALDMSKTTIPYGLVFATFMVMISIGSGIFKRMSHRVEQIPFVIFTIALATSVMTILTLEHEHAVFISFLIFEVSCGIMFPTYGSLRSIYIPDEHRTTIMNIYRIPLNVFVIIILINKQFMSLKVAFGACCLAYMGCILLWTQFVQPVKVSDGKEYEMGKVEEDYGDLDEYELESNDSEEDLTEYS